MIDRLVHTITENAQEFLQRLGEHVFLTLASTCSAIGIGIILAVIAFCYPRTKGPLVSSINILQTIPSLAMLALLLALFSRIGMVPAMIALTLYALLPIARGTLTGLENTPPQLMEAARGIGLTAWQQLWIVRFPLALPHIISGIRVAANIGVGIATIAAFIGAGGLGQFINRGLFRSDTELILLGAIPAALLALLIDNMIAFVQRTFFWGEGARISSSKTPPSQMRKAIALLLPILLFAAGSYFAFAPVWKLAERPKVVVGSKIFTESRILGEMIAQTIEANTPVIVERKFGLGGTLILHEALMNAEIDIYPEYTGTAFADILGRDVIHDANAVYHAVEQYYYEYLNLIAFPPLGFTNSYVFTVRKETAEAYKLEAISDLIHAAPALAIAVDFEFAEREDGLKALKRDHGLHFKAVNDMDSNLIYDVLARGEVDVIDGYSTDGRIESYGFVTLKDDIGFFPPYDAFFAARAELLRKYPKLKSALINLSGKITDSQMRYMNYQVDALGKEPSDVARDFLRGL